MPPTGDLGGITPELAPALFVLCLALGVTANSAVCELVQLIEEGRNRCCITRWSS